MNKYGLVILFSFLSFNVSASEADTFTRRYETLEDATFSINQKANRAIEQSIQSLNLKNQACNERQLYQELRLYFNNHMKGKLTIEIIKSLDIPRREIPLVDSIYGNWAPWDGLGLGLSFMKKSKETLASVISINGHYVGIDKFEHMFGQGYFYFSDNYLNNKGPIKAIKRGSFREKSILGGNKIANGIFSYGDLAANFNGMRMWNHLLQLRDDVLGSEYNLGPYIICENNKWVQTKEIDYSNYIDDSMDEAINCSKLTSNSTVRKFKKNINQRGLNCPVDQESLQNLITKYGIMAKWIINEEGLGVVNYFNEFKLFFF